MKKILFTMILIAAVNYGYAQEKDTYTQTLKTMFEVSGSEEAFQSAITQSMAYYRSQGNLPPHVINEMEAEFKKTSINDLLHMLTPVYRKYMTEADLQALITFYRTPAGSKYASNMGAIMAESMQIGQEWGAQIGERIAQRIQELQEGGK
ncbi:DUF2059 domain-containing protein [Robertkochia aurantiaca]|uniref:DUF2059 domain-containing protein n=1 Tax=Robertkochia aurantiaca TaxID=2873700 RepID=UPI001CCE6373|nr:DUF2059 domain-containing protein [Robertkochia sp. 3YJGBD-33]